MGVSDTLPTSNELRSVSAADDLSRSVLAVLVHFKNWLSQYGETSWDHQSFFAGPIGGRAKAFYYRSPKLGTLAVAPMIFLEAFLPSGRRLFHRPVRFPIADAHYAMGFAFLYQATGEASYFERALHFLDVLKATRCPTFNEYCWGYPFNWVTRGGVINQNMPLITTAPYVYEAFLQMYELEPREEWKEILRSIVRHVCTDIKDFATGAASSQCAYMPGDRGGVINAASYRAFLLASAARFFAEPELWQIGKRNLNFVLEKQNADGSWPYANDAEFVDHFHTCFVMKSLAKIYALTGDEDVAHALDRGAGYYCANLLDEEGLSKPFAKAPRLIVYKCELYDYAECINLCLLLRERFVELDAILNRVVQRVVGRWVKKDGSFRGRKLYFGWDNVPMHRWGQSQMFRSLAFFLREQRCNTTPARRPQETVGEHICTQLVAPAS